MCLNRPCQSDSQQDVVLVDEVDCVDAEDCDRGSQRTTVRFDDEDLIKSADKASSGSTVEYYDKARLGLDGGARREYVSPGDFVTVKPDMAGVPHFVAQLLALTREEDERGRELSVAHVRWMCRSVDTILGNDSEDEK